MAVGTRAVPAQTEVQRMEQSMIMKPRRRRVSLLRSTAAIAVALLAPLLLSTGAGASEIFERRGFGSVAGQITVTGDTTDWDLSVRRTGGSRCVYAKVTVDRNNVSDTTYRSKNACKRNVSVPFGPESHRHDFTRGAKVILCQDLPWRGDPCTQVWYEREV